MKIRINDQICDMPLRCFEFRQWQRKTQSTLVSRGGGADTSPVGAKTT